METNPEWATQFSDLELVEKAGTQGVELLMWLAIRAALTAAAQKQEREPMAPFLVGVSQISDGPPTCGVRLTGQRHPDRAELKIPVPARREGVEE